MTEKLIEKKLREAVSKAGGLALKFVSPGFTGVPDRIVLFPGGKVAFVELKSARGKQTERQKFVADQIRQLGFQVEVINDEESLNQFLK